MNIKYIEAVASMGQTPADTITEAVKVAFEKEIPIHINHNGLTFHIYPKDIVKVILEKAKDWEPS